MWPDFIVKELLMKKEKKFLNQNGMLKCLEEYGVKKSPSWAEQARFRKTGPRFCKIGGTVYYRSDWIDEFIEKCEGQQE